MKVRVVSSFNIAKKFEKAKMTLEVKWKRKITFFFLQVAE